MKIDIRSLEQEIILLHKRVCSALSDAKRIMILYLLSEKNMFVNEILETLNTTQSTIPRHLGNLHEHNLVSSERRGTAVLYSLMDKRIIKILNLMRVILNDRIQTEASIAKSISESS